MHHLIKGTISDTDEFLSQENTKDTISDKDENHHMIFLIVYSYT